MAAHDRDEFKHTTKLIIAHRAALLCSHPECRKLCCAPSTGNPDGDVNVGCASHICAASKGGPRYDPEQSAEERKSAANGIWLCRNHGQLIDEDEDAHPAPMLRLWKAQAEHFAARALGKPPSEWTGAPDRPEVYVTWSGDQQTSTYPCRAGSTPRPEPETPVEFSETEIASLSEREALFARAFNAEVRKYATQVAEALPRLAEWQDALEHAVSMRVELHNTGRAVLENAVVYLSFPEGLVVNEQDYIERRPALPTPPTRPRFGEGLGYLFAHGSGIDWLSGSVDLNALSLMPEGLPPEVRGLSMEGLRQFSGHAARLRHGHFTVFPRPVFVMPPCEHSRVEVHVEVHADNLPRRQRRLPLSSCRPDSLISRSQSQRRWDRAAGTITKS